MDENFIYFPEDIRVKVIDALQECQNSDGYWCYPPHRKDSEFVSVWTTAQALWALQLVGVRPKYTDKAYKILERYDTCIEDGNLVGWVHENTSELGVCITCDCCRAFILANKSGIVKKSVEKLLSIQRTNGLVKMGWGYTVSDMTSRITATCWVVDMLFYAVKDSDLVCDEINEAIKSAVDWIISAISIDGENEGWIGSPEGYKAFKMRGLGSSIMLIALIEAADFGFIDIDDTYIGYALEETKSEKNGWITPSYKETQVYENVYWILALSKLERLYLKHSKRIKNKYNALAIKYDRLLKWNLRIISWCIIAAIGFMMFKVFTLYSNNPAIPVLQSIIATFIWEYPLKCIAKAVSSRSKDVNG